MNARLSRVLQSGMAALATTVALLAGAPARAALVSFDYTGQAADGSTVQGRFGWHTDAPTSPATVGENGALMAQYYLGSGFLTGQVSGGVLDGQSVAYGGLDWLTSDLHPDNVHEGVPDRLFIVNASMFVMLEDYSRLALDSLALPTALNLSDWAGEHRVRLVGEQALEDYTLLSIAPTAVVPRDRHDLPEPGSLALLLLAAAGSLFARRFVAR